MITALLALYVFVCILLIIAVLMQSGKSSDISSALGGGISNDMFGPGAPANVMNKITTGIAVCFLCLSLILALMSNNRATDSILRNFPIQQPPVSGSE
ncbi:MAG: preprotein translocase subunit SecG [Deferribacteraceae bacterium]|jgi:preprotein translocase subunit SecG|nr:preprotein translocase subunit SecG [Deferribacteraceae bacterium]